MLGKPCPNDHGRQVRQTPSVERSRRCALHHSNSIPPLAGRVAQRRQQLKLQGQAALQRAATADEGGLPTRAALDEVLLPACQHQLAAPNGHMKRSSRNRSSGSRLPCHPQRTSSPWLSCCPWQLQPEHQALRSPGGTKQAFRNANLSHNAWPEQARHMFHCRTRPSCNYPTVSMRSNTEDTHRPKAPHIHLMDIKGPVENNAAPALSPHCDRTSCKT